MVVRIHVNVSFIIILSLSKSLVRASYLIKSQLIFGVPRIKQWMAGFEEQMGLSPSC